MEASFECFGLNNLSVAQLRSAEGLINITKAFWSRGIVEPPTDLTGFDKIDNYENDVKE